MGSAFGDHRVQAQPGSMAADTRESENSEHQSGSGDQHSMCQQGAPDLASPSTKVETAEGAGETGEPRMLLGHQLVTWWQSAACLSCIICIKPALPEVLLVIMQHATTQVELLA